MQKIQIICPSAHIHGFDACRMDTILSFLRKKDIEIIFSPHCFLIDDYCAGTIKERVFDIENAFLNEDIAVIMSFWGGRNTNQLLNVIDYEKISKKGKIIIGNSDMTALLLAIYAKTGMRTYYGPGLINFSYQEGREYMWTYFEKIFAKIPEYELEVSESIQISETEIIKNSGPAVYRNGMAMGVSIAGHAGTLLRLFGTEFMPNIEKAILFIEFSEEQTVGDIDRDLTQMQLLGVFKKINGLVIGAFRGESEMKKELIIKILDRVLRDSTFPVVWNCNFGHTYPIGIVPNGAVCQIATFPTIKILFSHLF